MADEKDVQDLDDQILKQMLQDFLEEALDLLDQLNLNLIQLEGEPGNEEFVQLIFRQIHTIKGSAGFAGLNEMSTVARRMEEIFGAIRKGHCLVTPQIIDTMFDALGVLSDLRDRAAAGNLTPTDVSGILKQLEQVGGTGTSPAEDKQPQETKPGDETGPEQSLSNELYDIYKTGYDQLSALKHLVYSSIHLTDEESLAALVSRQINKTMTPHCNEIWLMQDGNKVCDIARNGQLIPIEERRSVDVGSSKALQRVINEQLVVWSSSLPDLKEVLPGFTSPMVVPLKAQPKSFGFIVLDPEESAEVEVYQFVGQFTAMILNIAKLHRKVDEQRQELDEMTAILFRQNSILSSLYHVELALMKIKNPVDLCRIVAESFVHDLETRSAAIFLKNNNNELHGLWGSGLQGIDTMSFPIDSIEPVRLTLETGRIVSQHDFPDRLELGSNMLDNWIIMGLKGRETIHGVVVAELDIDDITDSMSILANYSGILLDNLMLQNRIEQ